ncbi:NAD(P)/FAD-dependent oxidoreductase [Thermoactinomyces mirandus]|uniref:NAD(P)/FAD-dependent oxidoreductase n=1 Tax=Thermoactinomyces mirandus TaxID=2756294 RepID=UPI001C68EA65|nr:NAD(P)/FAD-dependent oxidoreductase [Thermoactinomyces mirandus]
MGRIQEYSMLNCAVNPQAARERVTRLNPVTMKKKVLIVGGGVAGCEAARVLAFRGHEPELYEKSSGLGGNLIAAGAPKFKEDELALVNWYAHQLKKLNVPVHLNREVTKDFILQSQSDAVIVATGSRPRMVSLGDDDNVYPAADVLTGKKETGETVIVIGGGLVGCETALALAQSGKKVTIVEALDKLLALNGPLCAANREMLEKLVPFNGIKVITNGHVATYQDGKAEVVAENKTRTIPCDSVVLAVGYYENNTLYEDLQFEVPEIYLIGDARKVSNIMYAIWDAFEVANHI